MSQDTLFETVAAPLVFPTGDKRLVQANQLERLKAWIQDAPELFVDYETNGVDARKGGKPFSVGLFTPTVGAKVVDFRLLGANGVQAVCDGLKGRGAHQDTVAFNCQFETGMSRALGFELGGKLWDPMMAAFAVNELRPRYGQFGPLSQKALCFHELGKDPVFAKAVREWLMSNTGQERHGYEKVPPELMVQYQCEDVELGWELHTKLKKQVEANYQVELVRTDSELGRVISDLESRGLQLDVERAEVLCKQFQVKRKEATALAYKLLKRPFDIGADQALFGILYGEFGFPMHDDQEKRGKLDKTVLSWMTGLPQCTPVQKQFVEAVLEVRELDKLIDTYLLPWIYQWSDKGILYPNLNMMGAKTRRFSAEDPNLQNVPIRTAYGKQVRDLIITRAGWSTYSLDESQAEYRAFAHYSKDPTIIAGYKSGRNFDIHQRVSEMLSVGRKVGKNLNFGLLYGMGKDKLARELGVSLKRNVSKQEAEALLNEYYQKVPGVKSLKRNLELEIRRFGYVKDVFGGRKHLNHDEAYKALNNLCQMTVANLLRAAMVRAYPIIKRHGGNLLLQIHDEIVPEFPGDGGHHDILEEVRTVAMEDYGSKFCIPIVSDVERWSPSWAESKNAD
jgi:DNA polymerase-1